MNLFEPESVSMSANNLDFKQTIFGANLNVFRLKGINLIRKHFQLNESKAIFLWNIWAKKSFYFKFGQPLQYFIHCWKKLANVPGCAELCNIYRQILLFVKVTAPKEIPLLKNFYINNRTVCWAPISNSMTHKHVKWDKWSFFNFNPRIHFSCFFITVN